MSKVERKFIALKYDTILLLKLEFLGKQIGKQVMAIGSSQSQ